MGFHNKKMLSRAFALVLAIVFVSGALEITNMMGWPSVAYEALGSDGDYVPPSGGGGSSGGGSSSSGGGSSSASSGGSSSYSKAKKTAKNTVSNKKSNPIKVVKHTVTVDSTVLATRSVTVSRKTVMNINKAKGTLTYKKLKGNKKIKINKKTGKVTLKKGLAPGTYKVKFRVRAAGTRKYKAKRYIFTATFVVY